MPRYIAFLRGINLGKRRVAMSRLVTLFEELGHTHVKSFIASGNILFDSALKNSASIETKASQHLASSLGYEVDVFVRTCTKIAQIARAKHFPEDGQEGSTIHVGFLHQPLAPEISKKLEAITTPLDEFKVSNREYYWLCRSARSSDSKVWTLPEVKSLRLPSATMRNIKTIRKLADLEAV